MIDIEQLLPEYIVAHLWNESFVWQKINWKYLIKETVNDNINVDEVDIYFEDRLFDRIDKHIALRQWDTLELEYTIDVGE